MMTKWHIKKRRFGRCWGEAPGRETVLHYTAEFDQQNLKQEDLRQQLRMDAAYQQVSKELPVQFCWLADKLKRFTASEFLKVGAIWDDEIVLASAIRQ